MATTSPRKTELVNIRTQVARYVCEELDAKARAEGMSRATYLRRLVLRDLREGGST